MARKRSSRRRPAKKTTRRKATAKRKPVARKKPPKRKPPRQELRGPVSEGASPAYAPANGTSVAHVTGGTIPPPAS